MELLFETKNVDFLQEVLYAAISQEETGETIVPDSCPDVERILDTWGSVVLRGKDFRSGSLSISGGIQAGVIYAPEDGSAPRTLHLYIPFTIRMEAPELTEHAHAIVDCRLRSLDARILNSRKVMVRAALCGTVQGFVPASQELYVYAPEEDGDLQVRSSTYPVVRTLEMAEKPFTMAEEAELPGGPSPMQELCKYDASVEVTESKLVGSKGVFKGTVQFKLVYRTEDESLAVWSCQFPFSQYVEFEREYDGEEELQTSVMLTDFSAEDANGQGKRLLVNLQLLAQCTVTGQESMEVVEDAYSLFHTFTPQWKTVEAGGRLDRQQIMETARAQIQAPVKSILDTHICLGDPVAQWESEQVRVTLPLTAYVLYMDENDDLQGTSVRMEAVCSTEMAETCDCRPKACISGEAFAVLSGDGLEVRCTVAFTLDTMSSQVMQVLCGGQLGEERLSTADRPSVILRPVSEEESLWALAKCCHTTTDAICAANGLTDEASRPAGMLLIPIAK